jgi:hypothetical protein
MLDQSFSAHNFETIYNLENRRGTIDIQKLPKDYIDIISTIKETKQKIKISTTENTIEEKENLKYLEQKKESIFQNYLYDLEKEVNSPDFKITLKSFSLDGKEYFTIDRNKFATFFVIKQLQHNIRHLFKVKQANRHSILSNIKTFLNSKIPVYVIRTDITNFYESIPHNKLMPLLNNNTLLSNKSKSLIKGIFKEYEFLKDKSITKKGYGVPRGIGISSYLSEIYLRDIDKEISNRQEVLFYARYVDDIFIIINFLPMGTTTLDDYYVKIEQLFQEKGLILKTRGDEKCKILDFTKDSVPEEKFDYLGYKLCIKRDKRQLAISYSFSDEKQKKYKGRIDNIFRHFEKLVKTNIPQAYKDLFDCMNLITSNVKLLNGKSGVKVGLFYNNDLLDNMEVLNELTKHLNEKTDTINNLPIKLTGRDKLIEKIQKRIKKIDFRTRWEEKKMYKFSLQRLFELQKILRKNYEKEEDKIAI